jgi:twinkle protein
MNLIPDNIDFEAYANRIEDAAKVKPVGEYLEQVMDAFFNPNGEAGDLMPWDKTHDLFRFRPGELTIWHGMNGHGKSLIQGYVNLAFMQAGSRVCIASFEMKPVLTIKRMAKQAAGCNPSPAYVKAFHAWADQTLWFYDQMGTVKPKRVLGVIRYCAEELKVNHFVIDSLMKCGIRADDYNGQREFMDELTALAADLNIHIHLVAHSRKGDDEKSWPNKMDVAGSADITNMSHNVLNIWRNKAREKEKRKQEDQRDAEVMEGGDVLVICDKQRNGDWEGVIKLWMHEESKAYLGGDKEHPIDFFHFDQREWR